MWLVFLTWTERSTGIIEGLAVAEAREAHYISSRDSL
jgi:hypothetical protein